MEKLSKRRVKNFLKELTELSKRYKIAIGGCGCCGSPYLYPIDKKNLDNFYTIDGEFNNLKFTEGEKKCLI